MPKVTWLLGKLSSQPDLVKNCLRRERLFSDPRAHIGTFWESAKFPSWMLKGVIPETGIPSVRACTDSCLRHKSRLPCQRGVVWNVGCSSDEPWFLSLWVSPCSQFFSRLHAGITAVASKGHSGLLVGFLSQQCTRHQVQVLRKPCAWAVCIPAEQ